MINPIENNEIIVIFFIYKAFLFYEKCLQTKKINKKTPLPFFFVVFDLDLGIAQTRKPTINFRFTFLEGFLFFAINLISFLFFCRFQLVDVQTIWNSADQL